jgi:hypothetical protein
MPVFATLIEHQAGAILMGGSVIVAAKSDQIVSGDRAAARQPSAARVGTPQIGRSNQALTKHRPALPKRSP